MSDQPRHHAIVTDLDGSLVACDTFVAGIWRLAGSRPWMTVLVAVWALRGRAYCKARVAATAPSDPQRLPYESEVVELICRARASGHATVLATAADRLTADAVATHLQCFDAVLASDGRVNLKGRRKRLAIMDWCRAHRIESFTYIGDSAADMPIWEGATEIVIVRPSPALESRVRMLEKPLSVIPAGAGEKAIAAGVRDFSVGRRGRIVRVVDAITEAADGTLPIDPGRVKRDTATISRYVNDRIAGMQDHVRFLVALAIRAFDLLAIARYGKRFHRLPLPRRQAMWSSLRTARMRPAAMFAKLFDTLTIFGRTF